MLVYITCTAWHWSFFIELSIPRLTVFLDFKPGLWDIGESGATGNQQEMSRARFIIPRNGILSGNYRRRIRSLACIICCQILVSHVSKLISDLLPSLQAYCMWLCTGVRISWVLLLSVYHVSYVLGANLLYQAPCYVTSVALWHESHVLSLIKSSPMG